MSKPYVTTKILVHGNDTPFELTDYVDNNGKFVPLGTQAAAAIGRGDAVHADMEDGTEFVVPYHAIESVEFSKAIEDYTKPEDTYCVSEDGNMATVNIKLGDEVEETLSVPIGEPYNMTEICKGYLGQSCGEDSTIEGFETTPDGDLSYDMETDDYTLTPSASEVTIQLICVHHEG